MLDSDTDTQAPVDGRARRWREHNTRRRAEVVDAAVTAIDEQGTGVSVRQVAQRLNLPRPVVYRHFNGREDLDEQVRQRLVEMLLVELGPALTPDGTLRQAVRRAVGTYLAWLETHPHLHRFLLAGAGHRKAGMSQAISGARTAIAGQIENLVAQALATHGADPRLARPTAFGMLGFVDAVANRWRGDAGEPLDREQMTMFLTTSLCSMLVGNAREIGIDLDPEVPLEALLTG